MSKKQVKAVMFFPNGNTAVCDSNGDQIPELQKPWLLKYFEFMRLSTPKDYDWSYDNLSITLPNGAKAKIFVTPKGNLNWRIMVNEPHSR